MLQVACGSGLVRIYDFLRSDEPSQYPRDRMDRARQVRPQYDGSTAGSACSEGVHTTTPLDPD